jgi:hypothetical protein
MAEKHNEPKTTATIEMDAGDLVHALRKAGLDPDKVDLREVIGEKLDVEELQSRLRGVGARDPSRFGWGVSITINF